VLDSWEVKSVFDAEFAHGNRLGKVRAEEIRREHEAFWSTGQWNPPNYRLPDPIVSAAERTAFAAFHGPATQAYSCVLPGEIVRQCLEHMTAGTLDPVALLHLEQLIVDEFQDLNPVDLQFVERVVAAGVQAFAAGDDDQSIYSFRYASPIGIQAFTTNHPTAGQHALSECFRCTASVVAAARALIEANPGPNRIPKALASLYTAAAPPALGVVHRWRFQNAFDEARAVAESSRDLIQAGTDPRDILILLSNQHVLSRMVCDALGAAGVQFESPKEESFVDSEVGRFMLALLRIICDTNDYVAYRLTLGLIPGVGIGTCCSIRRAVIDGGLNFRDVFHQQTLPPVFNTRSATALNRARAVLARIAGWQRGDTLDQRAADIHQILTSVFGSNGAQNWLDVTATLPTQINMEELRNVLWADTDEQQVELLNLVFARLNQPVPPNGILPKRVRIMTMHGAKGLSARVVFVPGLEEETIPGPRRQPYPGLVLEAARLLYVSITRARAAFVVSYSEGRIVNGRFMRPHPSRFTQSLNGPFVRRTSGLTTAETAEIALQCGIL